MKFIIIFKLLAFTAIHPVTNAHENHDHDIYNWSNSENKLINTDGIFNGEKLEDKKKSTTKTKRSWINIFKK